MTVQQHPENTTVSLPPEELLILLRPNGMLARTEGLEGVELLLGDEGGLIKVPSRVGKLLSAADPTHAAELAFLRTL